MTEQDMADVAVYLAGAERAHRVEDRRAGHCVARRPAKSASPATAPMASASPPTIRRSPASTSDYLERALTDYQKGGRKNAVMAPHGAQR